MKDRVKEEGLKKEINQQKERVRRSEEVKLGENREADEKIKVSEEQVNEKRKEIKKLNISIQEREDENEKLKISANQIITKFSRERDNLNDQKRLKDEVIMNLNKYIKKN